MKKIIFISIILFVSLYILANKLDVFENKSQSENLPTNDLGLNSKNNELTNKFDSESTSKITLSDKVVTPQDVRNNRANYPNGVKITSLENSNLSVPEKISLKEKFDSLKQYGNFNKNKLGNEFKNIAKFRKNLAKNAKLAFTPVEIDFLNQEFDLTGKYYSGVYSKEKGFNSYTRLFENLKNNQKIELTEMYLNPESYTVVEIFTESLNKNINGLNLTWQEIPVGNTMVYTVDFVNQQKMYSLSTIRLEKNEVEALVVSLIKESNNHKNI